jgi:predicted DsbA family dithiol-disulfide isomerase
LERDAALAHLNGDHYVDEVRRELESGVQRGISGVPAFVFENRYLLPGAVDTDTFIQVFEQVSSASRT